MHRMYWIVLIGLLLTHCATGKTTQSRTLDPPAGTKPAALAAMEEGNRQFAQRQWEGAKAQYQAAIAAQPTLAEAHYNLAVVYDILRDDATARHHYIEAANLAPGNKVIWDAPPLRRHGDVDAHPSSSSGPSFFPALGGGR